MVSRLRAGRAASRPADLPGRLGRRPASGDHKSARYAVTGPNPTDEPELPGVQVPADPRAPLEQGVQAAHAARGHPPHVEAARVHARAAHHAARGLLAPVLRRAARAQ